MICYWKLFKNDYLITLAHFKNWIYWSASEQPVLTLMGWKQEIWTSIRIWATLTRAKLWWVDEGRKKGQLVKWWRCPCWLLFTVERVNKGHVSVRTGLWSSGRKGLSLPLLMNHVFVYIMWLAGCLPGKEVVPSVDALWESESWRPSLATYRT